jgi:hypothetical protein
LKPADQLANFQKMIQLTPKATEEISGSTRFASIPMMRFLILSFACCLLASCSTAFKREWKVATARSATSEIEGAWQGTWISTANGHHGNLRCIVGPKKSPQGDREFHYHATWAGLVGGAYRATHRVLDSKGVATFTGEHLMPRWAGGRYVYDGTIKGDAFNASYECSKDKGTFQMQRVK